MTVTRVEIKSERKSLLRLNRLTVSEADGYEFEPASGGVAESNSVDEFFGREPERKSKKRRDDDAE